MIFGSAGHFWFFPAIVIATCLVSLCYKAKLSKFLLPVSMMLYLIGCLGCSYFHIGSKIPLLRELFAYAEFTTVRRIFMMGLPFFCLGSLIMKLEHSFSNVKKLYLSWFASLVFFLAEIYTVTYFDLHENIIITPGLYLLLLFTMLILLKHPLSQCSKVGACCRTIANFTYYSHIFILQVLPSATQIVGIHLPNIGIFCLTLLITFTLGYILHYLYTKKNFRFIKYIVG